MGKFLMLQNTSFFLNPIFSEKPVEHTGLFWSNYGGDGGALQKFPPIKTRRVLNLQNEQISKCGRTGADYIVLLGTVRKRFALVSRRPSPRLNSFPMCTKVTKLTISPKLFPNLETFIRGRASPGGSYYIISWQSLRTSNCSGQRGLSSAIIGLSPWLP